MTLSRRRFLSISAACVALPTGLRAARWDGRALGADVSITIDGPAEIAEPALRRAQAVLRQVERQFSLYDPASALVQLNRDGVLHTPDPMFVALMTRAGQIHAATGGLFDPTVQPLWRALASGGDTVAANALIGWDRLRFDATGIALGAGQALTLNGIAQGFATDVVAEVLRDAGLREVLVDIGEMRSLGGAWKIGLQDPVAGILGMRTLREGAIATSSPNVTLVGGQGHILHPAAVPKWSTVSVEAPDATTADGFSTALVLASLEEIKVVQARAGLGRISVVNWEGELTTV